MLRSLPPLGLLVIASCGRGLPSRDAGSPRAEFEALARRLAESENDWIGLSAVRRLRDRLAREDLEARERRRLEGELAERLVRDGKVQEGIEILERHLAGAPPDSAAAERLHRRLGVFYLRLAEVQNCIQRHNADCCIFPLAGGGVHAERAPALRAREHFLAFLSSKPGNLKVRWLLNVLAMALGDYPEGVPEEYRIPLTAFASQADPGRFRDVAPDLGLDVFDRCGGVVVEDFDGDGWLDVLTSSYDPLEELRLFLNRGPRGFVNASVAWGTDQQLGGFNLLSADYDGDGDRDAFVLRGAWLGRDGRLRNSLLENRGDRFVDVTHRAGLADPARPTQSGAFGDLDGDGVLDLFIANESARDVDPQQDFPCQLFRGRGDGTFTDRAAQAGTTNDRYAKGVTLGDYDDDGDLDIYVSNFGPNRLYRNEGGLSFRDVAAELAVEEPVGRSFATWFFDWNQDGHLDLFVVSYSGSIADLAAEALGRPRNFPTPRLYENRGGTFEDVTAKAGLARFFLPMGANFGDIDEDGWLDLYLTTGDPQLETVLPDVMLRNDRGLSFQDVTLAGGFGHLQKGHGVAFCDLDEDGDQDIYHQIGGFYAGDRFHDALFENPGHGRHFVVLELVGQGGNRDAIGARVRLTAKEGGAERVLHRWVGSVSSFGGSPLRLEVGLGNADLLERVEVRWPGATRWESFEGIELDSRVRLHQGGGVERLRRAPFHFPVGEDEG